MSGELRLLVDDKEMREYLEGLDEKGVVTILRKGVTAAAPTLKRAMVGEIPVKSRASAGAHGIFTVRKRGVRVEQDYGTPGGMRASVKARRIRSNPAIGVVVGPMGKQAFMRHWVAAGTKPHLIRPKRGSVLRLAFGFAHLVHHPGQRPNDYAARALAKAEAAAVELAEAKIIEEATK